MNSSEGSRVAIVTGGSRGIGRQSALRLAGDGMAVALVYSANRDSADEAVAAVADTGASAIAVRADVGDEGAVAEAFVQVEEAFGGIDVVVNAAGIMPLAPIAELDLAVLDRIYHTNIRGCFVVSKEAARRVRRGGAIVNFSSSVTRLQPPNYAAYAASKGAVEAMTLVLARELRGRDVTANAIAPGPTATGLFFEGKDREAVDRVASQSPLGRLGTPEDIAEAVAYVAGPGHWVNGQVLYVNGGIV